MEEILEFTIDTFAVSAFPPISDLKLGRDDGVLAAVAPAR